jgi:hypothetical protein
MEVFMSGGSWDYICFRIDEVADRLQHEKSPLRRAFGQHLDLCAKAMHDIEWVYSCDMGPGDEMPAIKAVLEDAVPDKTLNAIKDDIEFIRKQLDSIVDR